MVSDSIIHFRATSLSENRRTVAHSIPAPTGVWRTLYSGILQHVSRMLVRYILSECVSRIKSILSVIFHAIYGAVCIQLTHLSYDDYENACTLSYYHHQMGSMTHLPLFRVRSWNNGMRCMSFNILISYGIFTNGMIIEHTETLIRLNTVDIEAQHHHIDLITPHAKFIPIHFCYCYLLQLLMHTQMSYFRGCRCSPLEAAKCKRIFRCHQDTMSVMKRYGRMLAPGARDRMCKDCITIQKVVDLNFSFPIHCLGNRILWFLWFPSFTVCKCQRSVAPFTNMV